MQRSIIKKYIFLSFTLHLIVLAFFAVQPSASLVEFSVVTASEKPNNNSNSKSATQGIEKMAGKVAGAASGTASEAVAPIGASGPLGTVGKGVASGVGLAADSVVATNSAATGQMEKVISIEYPLVSRELGEEGTVILEISGNELRMIQSSGFARLDRAAVLGTQVIRQMFRQAEAPRRLSVQFRLSEAVIAKFLQ